MNCLDHPARVGPFAFVLLEQFSTLSEIVGAAGVFDEASRKEFAFVLKHWRIANQILELSTDLVHAMESQRRIMWDSSNTPYRFHLDDILTRQVQEHLLHGFDGKVSQAECRGRHAVGFKA